MTKVQQLRAKIDKHSAYYTKKYKQFKKMDEKQMKSFSRLKRLALHQNLLLDLKIQFADAVIAER